MPVSQLRNRGIRIFRWNKANPEPKGMIRDERKEWGDGQRNRRGYKKGASSSLVFSINIVDFQTKPLISSCQLNALLVVLWLEGTLFLITLGTRSGTGPLMSRSLRTSSSSLMR